MYLMSAKPAPHERIDQDDVGAAPDDERADVEGK
jgi:hypothetical protein